MFQQSVGERPKVLRRFSAEFKKKAIDRGNELNNDVAAAAELNIGSSTISKWRKRFEKDGLAGLVDMGSRPNHQPKKTSQWIIDKIISLKKNNPEMGSTAASQNLMRHENVSLSAKTVAKVFKQQNLCDGDEGHAEMSYKVKGDKDKRLEQTLEKEIGVWERFSRAHPNELWQMDIMCFYIRDAHQVYLISALDDCSRMIVGWGLYRQQTADNVLEVLRSALARHGAPKEILTDQGAQFKHWGGVTQFEKLLSKLNIVHTKARPHHPQTCGKIEAYHKTIQRELIDKDFFLSQEQAIERIARFVEHYNHARPHSSLDGFTPSDRYFGVIEALKKYQQDLKAPKNELEEKAEEVGIGRGSKVYMIGKILGQDVRVQELSGQLSIYLNNHPWHEINLLR